MTEYISTITLLHSPWNTNITEKDFMLESDTPIRLRKPGAWVILFYGEDETSKQVLNTWAKAAQITIGPEFGSCNLRMESQLASKILDTHSSNASLKWTNTLRVPYVLSYYNTWPMSKYTGTADVQSLSNWALSSYTLQDAKNLSVEPEAKKETVETKPATTKETEVTIPKTLD